jgi:hypothetical protein
MLPKRLALRMSRTETMVVLMPRTTMKKKKTMIMMRRETKWRRPI